MAFGNLRERTEQQRERRKELNREYRERQKRITAKDDLDQLFKAQNARIAKTLKASTDRVNRARWGNPRDGDGLFSVTRHGTCEVSKPLRREYTEQL